MDYRNVYQSPEIMAEMVTAANGRRNVPVIVLGDQVIVGYGGT